MISKLRTTPPFPCSMFTIRPGSNAQPVVLDKYARNYFIAKVFAKQNRGKLPRYDQLDNIVEKGNVPGQFVADELVFISRTGVKKGRDLVDKKSNIRLPAEYLKLIADFVPFGKPNVAFFVPPANLEIEGFTRGVKTGRYTFTEEPATLLPQVTNFSKDYEVLVHPDPMAIVIVNNILTKDSAELVPTHNGVPVRIPPARLKRTPAHYEAAVELSGRAIKYLAPLEDLTVFSVTRRTGKENKVIFLQSIHDGSNVIVMKEVS